MIAKDISIERHEGGQQPNRICDTDIRSFRKRAWIQWRVDKMGAMVLACPKD